MPSFKDRILNAYNALTLDESPKPNTGIIANFGTRIVGGIYNEDHIRALAGPRLMAIFDQMQTSDTQVSMILNAITNPLLKATVRIDPTLSDDEEGYDDAKKIADFCSHVIFNDMDRPWELVWEEILSFIPFGFSLFWEQNKIVKKNRDWGDYIGISELRYISQKTVERWNIHPQTGELISIDQQVHGDMAEVRVVPADFLHPFTLKQKGANYEGMSILRQPYGNWLRKNTYLKLEAIGIERTALDTPICKVPETDDDETRTKMEAVIRKLSSHELQSAMIPNGWEIDFIKSNFSADTVQKAIAKEDEAITRSICANFLNLGQGGNGGAYALGQDLSDFFIAGIEYLARVPKRVFNHKILPRLVRMNFGPDAPIPEFCISGISDQAGTELATIISTMKNSGAFGNWSEEDSRHARERFNWIPMRNEEPQAVEETPDNGNQDSGGADGKPEDAPEDGKALSDKKKRERVVRFASPVQSLMEKGSEGVGDLMRSSLTAIKDKLIADLLKAWESLPESSKADATRQVEVGGVTKYRTSLQSAMTALSIKSLNQVVEENKKIKTTKFDLRFADPLAIQDGFKISDFKRLPKHVKKGLQAQADLLARAQAADLEKAVKFQYANSITSTDSIRTLGQDLEEIALKEIAKVEGVALTTASKLVNETRHFFFFDDDVLEQLESFTFRNPDPVTQICNDLVDRVFTKTDNEALRYEPPLHWNCKSYLEANAEGSGAFAKAKEDKMAGLYPSKAGKAEISLCDKDHFKEMVEIFGKSQADVLSRKWIDPNHCKPFDIHALSFDPEIFDCQHAVNYAKNLFIEVSETVKKGGRLLGVVRESDQFDRMVVVDLGDGVKAIIGNPKGIPKDAEPAGNV